MLGVFSGTTTVRVTLEDINDNGPYFKPEIPEGTAAENKEPYTQIIANLVPITSDYDLTPNKGPYQYRLLDHTSQFDVGLTSGLVQAKVRLDRETTPIYQLRLQVSDGGSPKMTSTLTMSIAVTDENDNPSTARSVDVLVYAYDGQFPGGMIADVQPLDPDVVGDYSCTLVDGDRSVFSIPTGCQLTTDYVFNGQKYNLRVSGSDGIHTAVSSFVKVEFRKFDKATAENSISVQLTGTASEFLETSYEKFVPAVQGVLDSTISVLLFGVSDTSDGVEVFLAAKQSDGSYQSRSALTLTIQANRGRIESQAAISISQVNYNPCNENPCLNGAECSATIEIHEDKIVVVDSPRRVFTGPLVAQTAVCVCRTGYTGHLCDTPINQCTTNPCLNGGVCLGEVGAQVTCDCTDGWTGMICDQDVNECLERQPCKHNGVCTNTFGSYTCKCSAEFTGKDCDGSIDFCQSSPCQYGGTCIPQAAGYRCQCGFGEQGTNCEFTSRGFQTLSYMEVPPVLDDRYNMIVMEFSTIKNNALLLYSTLTSANSEEFMAIEVVGGQVRFSFALDGSSISRLVVPLFVDDGSWYKVQAQRDDNVSIPGDNSQNGQNYTYTVFI